MMRHRQRAFVARLDFVTTAGFLDGGDARARAGYSGRGPTRIITDLGVLEPDPLTRELTLMALHPGSTESRVREATGWQLAVADSLGETPPVTDEELGTLRELQERTAAARAAE